jgi:hypothetical protein
MENLIEFFDWKRSTVSAKKKLGENDFAIWYNKKNTSYCVTINNQFKTDKEFVKFGKLGNSIAMVFNNEDGFRLHKVGMKESQNITFACVHIVKMVFAEMKEEKNRKLFKYNKVNNDVLIFNL